MLKAWRSSLWHIPAIEQHGNRAVARAHARQLRHAIRLSDLEAEAAEQIEA